MMGEHLILGLGRPRMHEGLLALGNRTRPTAGNLTPQWIGGIGLAAAVGSAYFLVAYLSVTGLLFLASEGVALFWPAAGISAGVLIAFGPRARWPVAAGVFVAVFLIVRFVMVNRNVWLATIFALCDVVEPLIIAELIRRYFGADFALDRLRNVFGLLAATVAGTVPSSLTAAVASRFFLGESAPILPIWEHWWSAVASGVVAVAPLIIGFSAAMREPPGRRELIEGSTALLTLGAITGGIIFLPQQTWETVLPGALLFPILLWLAARCQPVFAAAGAFMVTLTLAWTTILEIGYLGNAALPVDARILQAQAVILVTAIGSYVLAALFAERKQSEARLALSNMRLERERDNKLMNAQAIVRAIAHEIRQPLTRITAGGGAAQRFLKMMPPAQDKAQTALQGIVSAAHRTSEVIDGFRVLFEKADQERQLVDVNEIIRQVLESLSSELTDHHVEPRLNLMSGLPHIYGNRSQLGEVVSNLIINAIEAMDATTDRTRVLRVKTELGDRKAIAVVIEDTGPGIDKEVLGDLFTAFVTTKRHGRGLGLAICRMIVDYHGGKLTASSDGKGGASFELVLPIASID